MIFVICLPGIPSTGEPPGFLLAGKAPADPHVWIATDHPKYRADGIQRFDTKDEADRWVIERSLARPDDDLGDWVQLGQFVMPSPIVVADEALTDWEPYRG